MELEDQIESWMQTEEFDRLNDLVALGAAAVPVLIGMARQAPEQLLRIRALEVLGRIGDRRALPLLEETIASGASFERLTAAVALAEVAGAGAVATLAPLLDDPDPSLVKFVLRSLAEVGDATALAALERVKERPPHEFLREEAAAAMQSIRERIG